MERVWSGKKDLNPRPLLESNWDVRGCSSEYVNPSTRGATAFGICVTVSVTSIPNTETDRGHTQRPGPKLAPEFEHGFGPSAGSTSPW